MKIATIHFVVKTFLLLAVFSLLLMASRPTWAVCNPFIDQIMQEDEQGEARAAGKAKGCVQYIDCAPNPREVTQRASDRRWRRFFGFPDQNNPPQDRGAICIDPEDPPDPGRACGPV